MAGDWIPMRVDLCDDPAVIAIAAAVGLDEYGVTGRLHRLWAWANRQLIDGIAAGITSQWVDRYLSTPGFAAAMLDAGWLRARSGGIEFPHFDRWNSEGAKRRLEKTLRKRAERRAVPEDDRGPTPRRQSGDKVATQKRREGDQRREEERREEGKTKAEESPEPAKPPASGPAADASPPFMEFPCVGTGAKNWVLTQAKFAEYRGSFPGVNVEAELAKARQWLRDNSAKRKTPAGMPRFVGNWLARAQDDAARRTAPAGGRSPTMTRGEAMDDHFARMAADAFPIPAGGSPQ